MAENKIKPLMDQQYFAAKFDETTVGFRADLYQVGALQSIERNNIEQQIRDFVPNSEWRKNVEEKLEKGIVIDDPEVNKAITDGLRLGKLNKESSMDEVLDYVEEIRDKNQEWRKAYIDLKDELSERHYDRLTFWARDSNFKGYFNGETAEDMNYRFGNVQYNEERNIDSIDKRIAEYQREYSAIFGHKDPAFDIENQSDEVKNQMREQFYNNILRSQEKEQEQVDRMLKNEGATLNYEDHPEAERYHFLEQAYNNPALLDENTAEMVRYIKANDNIPEEDKVKAFLTLADNNMVHDGLMEPSEALYYDPNFKISYEDQVKVLQDAGLMEAEKNLTDEQKALQTVFDDPLQSIKNMLPENQRHYIDLMIDKIDKQENNDDTPLHIPDNVREDMKSYLPEDMQQKFDSAYQVASKTESTPEYIKTLLNANANADENKLSDVSLSQVQEATETMLDRGKNQENLIELTNNATLEQKLTNDNDMKLKNQMGNGFKMKPSPSI